MHRATFPTMQLGRSARWTLTPDNSWGERFGSVVCAFSAIGVAVIASLGGTALPWAPSSAIGGTILLALVLSQICAVGALAILRHQVAIRRLTQSLLSVVVISLPTAFHFFRSNLTLAQAADVFTLVVGASTVLLAAVWALALAPTVAHGRRFPLGPFAVTALAFALVAAEVFAFTTWP